VLERAVRRVKKGSKRRRRKLQRGEKPKRGSTAGQGQLWVVRTDSQEDQGFEVLEVRPKRWLRLPETRETGKGRTIRRPKGRL